MKMNELQTLNEIFQNKIFRIPDYQRGYAWKEPQLIDFWEDILNLQEDRFHYTGLLSLKKNGDNSKATEEEKWLTSSGFSIYEVVDGQQRLTTFVIMLNGILELVRGIPENKGKKDDDIYLGYERLKDIQGKYISRKRPPEEMITTYMFGYEKDDPSSRYIKYKIFNQQYGGMLEETYYTKNLQFAKKFFAARLNEFYDIKGIEGIRKLYLKLTQNMMFNIHEIDDDYDVFVAFETMNNRGKKLTNLELLKNRLIYLTTLYRDEIFDETDKAALRKSINETWSQVYYHLGRNENRLLSDDDFLRAHWTMYFTYSRKTSGDYIKFLLNKFSNKSIFENAMTVSEEEEEIDIELGDEEEEGVMDIIPETVSGEFLYPREIQEYVNSLNETAEFWYYTYFPYDCNTITEEEKICIDRINRIGIGYFRPLIAVSLVTRMGISSEERIAFLKAVERFIFIIFRMGMYQGTFKSSEFYRKVRAFYKGNVSVQDLTNELNRITDSELDNALSSFVIKNRTRYEHANGFYTWNSIRYFLYEYEYSLGIKHKIEKLSWALLSKVMKDKVSIEHILPQTPTNEYWTKATSGYDSYEVRIMSSSLGNLLPLSQSINSSLQNDSFDKKIERGYSNGCHSEIEVSKADIWDPQHIYDRGMKLLSFMEKRWDFQFSSKAQKEEILHMWKTDDGIRARKA